MLEGVCTLRVPSAERLWCKGSTTGSNPVGQGSSPWGRASSKKRTGRADGNRRVLPLGTCSCALELRACSFQGECSTVCGFL
jgi:hypothetical protein